MAEPEQVHTEVPAEGNKEAAQTEVFEPGSRDCGSSRKPLEYLADKRGNRLAGKNCVA